jgi:HSP20 family protein
MTMTRWVPREVGYGYGDPLDREFRFVSRLFDDVARAFDRGADWSEPAGLFPRVDLLERNEEYVMRADLPGLRREDVEIDVAPDHVVVRGRYAESDTSDTCVVCSERSAGSFERTIPFPGDVRVEDVSASMKDGLLTVHLPKAQASNMRRIELTEH